LGVGFGFGFSVPRLGSEASEGLGFKFRVPATGSKAHFGPSPPPLAPDSEPSTASMEDVRDCMLDGGGGGARSGGGSVEPFSRQHLSCAMRCGLC
jgi:hypothetical protein